MGSNLNSFDPINGHGWSRWYLLFLVQFAAVLWPPFFNIAEPRLIGIPFFYWYQLFCILIGAGITAIIYFATATNQNANTEAASGGDTV